MPQPYTITFTTGLIDKLAGIKKPEPPKPAPTQPSVGRLSVPAGLSREALAYVNSDAQLQRQLQASKQVNGLLLKNEEEEAKKVSELTDQFLKQYSATAKPVPCQKEKEACLSCYSSNPQDALRCADVVAAYSACASKEFAQAAR